MNCVVIKCVKGTAKERSMSYDRSIEPRWEAQWWMRKMNLHPEQEAVEIT